MPEEGGCNERSMMAWRAAMKQWKTQQAEWEYHFNMWKGNHMEEMDDHYGSGDHDEWGSGDYDHHYEHDYPQHNGDEGSFWEMIMPWLEYMSTDEFCDMFQMLPQEWDPTHWTGICKANNKLNRELSYLIGALWQGIGKDEWSEKMCMSVGYYLKYTFQLSYWPEGMGYVDALYEPCLCTHNIVYDLSMGSSPNLPGIMMCGNTWMGAMNNMDNMEIPQNFTISPAAEQLLGFWLDSDMAVMKFKEEPIKSLQYYAKEWMTPAYKLYEGLQYAEMLLDQVNSKMAAYGLDNSNFDSLNGTDLKNEIVSQQLELFALPTNLTEKIVEKRLHGFFEDPDAAPVPEGAMLKELMNFTDNFGFDTEKMTQLFMTPFEQSMNDKGEMQSNLAIAYDMYTKRMNELVQENPQDRVFIPVDAFHMLMEHREELYMEHQAHTDSGNIHSFVDHVFATWTQVITNAVMMMEAEHYGMKK